MVQGNSSAAQEALDQAVGISFGIRESAAYASVKAQLLLAEGSSEEAERLLQAAMNMPGVKRQPTSQPRFATIPVWQQVVKRQPTVVCTRFSLGGMRQTSTCMPAALIPVISLMPDRINYSVIAGCLMP